MTGLTPVLPSELLLLFRAAASRHLLAYCLHIGSPDQLKLFLRSICDSHPSTEFAAIAQSSVHLSEPSEGCLTGSTKSLVLAPYPDYSIDDRNIALAVSQLFGHLANSITRLSICIPLRSLYPEDDRELVRPILRNAFLKLKALEEFASWLDELYLRTNREISSPTLEPAVWASWPQLKRLALYNVDVSSSDFLRDIQNCEHLTHLIITRADGLNEIIESPSKLRMSPFLRRVAIVNTADGHKRPHFSRRGWKNCFLGKIWASGSYLAKVEAERDLKIVRIHIPLDDVFIHEEIAAAQKWVGEATVNGTLWDWPGQVLTVKEDDGTGILPEINWQSDGMVLQPEMYWDSD